MSPEEILAAVRPHCLTFPEATEDNPWGHTAWKVRGKMFCIGDAESNRLTIKATPDEQAALVQHPQIERAAYVGKHGWVTITVDCADTLDLALDLIDRSYELVAPKRRS